MPIDKDNAYQGEAGVDLDDREQIKDEVQAKDQSKEGGHYGKSQERNHSDHHSEEQQDDKEDPASKKAVESSSTLAETLNRNDVHLTQVPMLYSGPLRNAGYHDASLLADPTPDPRRNRGGVTEPFPVKLHRMLDTLELEESSDIASFLPHGRAFAIHRPKQFASEVMPRFFRQSKLTSFQRQLNLYGFRRISHGPDSGGYYHSYFLKGRPAMCCNMKRLKVKGDSKAVRDPESEPNFYSYPPIKQGGDSPHVPAQQWGAPMQYPGYPPAPYYYPYPPPQGASSPAAHMMYPPPPPYGYPWLPYGYPPPPPPPPHMMPQHHGIPSSPMQLPTKASFNHATGAANNSFSSPGGTRGKSSFQADERSDTLGDTHASAGATGSDSDDLMPSATAMI